MICIMIYLSDSQPRACGRKPKVGHLYIYILPGTVVLVSPFLLAVLVETPMNVGKIVWDPWRVL